jgi:CheY-like chemotaxis protein
MKKIDWKLIKVLVVDDDPTVLKLLKKYIDKIGCAGAYAENGKQAIAMIKQYNFDICFMDLIMPEMGGIEATFLIREEYDQKIPIIALTALSLKANKEKCLEIGMNDFINKPVSLEMIKDVIQRFALNPKAQ